MDSDAVEEGQTEQNGAAGDAAVGADGDRQADGAGDAGVTTGDGAATAQAVGAADDGAAAEVEGAAAEAVESAAADTLEEGAVGEEGLAAQEGAVAADATTAETAPAADVPFLAGSESARLIVDGGPVIWIIVALSVATMALAIWKLWRFTILGTGRRARVQRALALWSEGREREARDMACEGGGAVCRAVSAAMSALTSGDDEDRAREETTRVAKATLADLRVGLRGLEVIVTIAPLLGLLGTVLGMIEAFQTLQSSGSRADPSALAGGIWEALLTTAAGMAVAIPAGVALTYFESVVEKVRVTIEDSVTRVFVDRRPSTLSLKAAE